MIKAARRFLRQCVVFVGFFVQSTALADDVTFADASLDACVNAAIQKAKVGSAQDLTTLICNAQGIKDATGLGQLRKLEQLSLFGNQLSAIDTQGLTALRELNLANNALTQIDLSSNAALQVLYLFGNQLEALDLSAARSLVKLKAEKNSLLSVTFASLPTLEKVYLFDNKMEAINIDGLTALRFIDVRSNPMPDEVYDYLDAFSGVKASHDGNTEDWE